MRILMVAAENDALPRGKVGGVGDVIRDVPAALAALGEQVDVITPCYGYFATLPGAHSLGVLCIDFAGRAETVELFEIPSTRKRASGVRNLVISSAPFREPVPGVIYSNDPEQPFATDATRFALFGRAVLEFVRHGLLPAPEVMHLHDWHSAMVAILRAFHPEFRGLFDCRTVFSIHNLALQGIRPFRWHSSSLEAWFPGLEYDAGAIADPRYADCFNPMRAGIRLADRVHTVSPTYATEVLRASDPELGFVGGEGLEQDLAEAHNQGRLLGILNGADYDVSVPRRLNHQRLFKLAASEVMVWMGRRPELRSADFIAFQRLQSWLGEDSDDTMLLTSIGRLTHQKVSLLVQPWGDEGTVLEALLNRLGKQARLLVIGSGDAQLEAQFVRVASVHDNLVFLNGYAESLADQVYSSGDLFLMPSSFEPCGISQMLSMRAGQPCLVHAVGGLRDTVQDGVTGFQFAGASPTEQAEQLLERTERLVRSFKRSPRKWQSMRKRAAATRFLWEDTARQYLDKLYA